MRWTLRARNTTDFIRKHWLGRQWIIELVSTGRREDDPFRHVRLFITIPKALQLVQQRRAIENQWYWPRDTQLSENTHRYAQLDGVQVLALLRILALKLLRFNGFHLIRVGLMAVVHNIS